MARIKFGGIVSDISGSVGGSTFQRSNYGTSLRNKPSPIHRRSPSQVDIRYKLTQLHVAWRALTPAGRQQWNRFINFSGQTIRRDRAVLMSGHDLFIKYNLAKLMIGDAILTVPTYISMPTVPLLLSPWGYDVGMFYTWFEDAFDDDALFFIYKMTTPRLPSQSYSPRGLRFIPINIDPTGLVDAYAGYLATFGFIPNAQGVIHTSLQWFSRVSPIFNAPITSVDEVTSL
jgi:hypothetical protein